MCPDNLQDAFIILQYPQENAYQGISFNVLGRTLSKEDVCLVEKHNPVPSLCELECSVQCRLNFFRFEAKVTAGDGQERLPIGRSDAFSGCSFANTRCAMEKYDYTFALFSNEVKVGLLVLVLGKVSADESLDDALVTIREFEVIPRILRPIDAAEPISASSIEAQPQACLTFCQLISFRIFVKTYPNVACAR